MKHIKGIQTIVVTKIKYIAKEQSHEINNQKMSIQPIFDMWPCPIFFMDLIKLIILFINIMIKQQQMTSEGPIYKKIQNYIFKFSDLLGQGNFSKVYRAHHEISSKPSISLRWNSCHKNRRAWVPEEQKTRGTSFLVNWRTQKA